MLICGLFIHFSGPSLSKALNIYLYGSDLQAALLVFSQHTEPKILRLVFAKKSLECSKESAVGWIVTYSMCSTRHCMQH